MIVPKYTVTMNFKYRSRTDTVDNLYHIQILVLINIFCDIQTSNRLDIFREKANVMYVWINRKRGLRDCKSQVIFQSLI